MKQDKDIEDKEKELFSRLSPTYSKSKSDVWAEMETTINSPKKKPAKIVQFRWAKFAAAASVILILGFGLFARFYTITVEIPAGEYTSHVLPDGSKVFLNSESSINYHPYWWSFNRQLELNGEAFFEVEKGNTFTVESELASVTVLGTSFNIYARGADYRVYCATGKVSVTDKKTSSVVLTPGEGTVYQNAQPITLEKTVIEEETTMAWRNNKFIYKNCSINDVIKDFELHYDVTISNNIADTSNLKYTGLFNRDLAIEEALEIISFSLDLTVESDGKNNFTLQ